MVLRVGVAPTSPDYKTGTSLTMLTQRYSLEEGVGPDPKPFKTVIRISNPLLYPDRFTFQYSFRVQATLVLRRLQVRGDVFLQQSFEPFFSPVNFNLEIV